MDENEEMSYSATKALEQFRKEWKEEVTARSKKSTKPTSAQSGATRVRRNSDSRPERTINRPQTRHPLADVKDDSDSDRVQSAVKDITSPLIQRIEGLTVKGVDEDDFSAQGSHFEPKSALEHFERAVEKESQGNLRDSLSHYRTAYKLDAKVDQSYKNKHFPAKSQSVNPNPSNAPAIVPSTAHHSSKEPDLPLSYIQLIESFANEAITGVEPIIPGDRKPPCPMAGLPSEVLLDLLEHVAVQDPATFVRLGQVCKKLAYHIHSEERIWKRLALGPEFGLSGQRYSFATDVQGREAIFASLDEDINDISRQPITELSLPQVPSWKDFFQNYPRIRYTGVYISTVNYTRPGGASATQAVWSNPIHVVTYYRYIRFFRDGTCISLLTVNEPIDVVHHLTPENLTAVRSNRKEPNHPLNFTSSAAALMPLNREGVPILPPSAQNIMKHALRGRWRLCHPAAVTLQENEDPIMSQPTQGDNNHPSMALGDVHIETEGAGPRYMYTMHLSLKSGARSRTATKNNKLQWKGFWSYNNLTDDWAEFTLRNDKTFHFSRVKSYGLGY